jgi:pimeloyl-ACP methyl ester carboxylesterase
VVDARLKGDIGLRFGHLMVAGLSACVWLCLAAQGIAAERWQTLPPTPAPVAGETTGYAPVNGIKLFYATIGHGAPVVLLHGGLANSDYWGNQVRALMAHHQVILVDSRGHGRSSRSAAPFGYDLMTDDVVALLDRLKIGRADIVGWSDGAILGLDMALRHPDRVGRVFAFGANTNLSGFKKDVEQNPNFAAFIRRASEDYKRLSPTPTEYTEFHDQISKMWNTQPNWTDAQLATIHTPVLIADGQHDEGITLDHNLYMAAHIPQAGLLILPNVSHFAFLQDPVLFNTAMLRFLDFPPD